MIATLCGRVTLKDAEMAVIDCNGVGYGVSMSITGLSQLVLGELTTLFVYTHVGQDVLRLFGFIEAQEKKLFELLLNTSGVGPKLALAILSHLSPEELATVVADDDKQALVRIPGVGKKTAERLLLELKDRLPKVAVSRKSEHGLRQDVVAALTHLGFVHATAEEAAMHAMKTLPEARDVAVLMREALRFTRKLSA